MTRKDYVLLAAALRNAQPPEPEPIERAAWLRTVYSVADALMRDNPRFDPVRFHKAAGLED